MSRFRREVMAGNYATDEQIDALEEEVSELLARIAELGVALKPFADASDLHLGSEDMSIAFGITIKDLRQARKVLGEKE